MIKEVIHMIWNDYQTIYYVDIIEKHIQIHFDEGSMSKGPKIKVHHCAPLNDRKLYNFIHENINNFPFYHIFIITNDFK